MPVPEIPETGGGASERRDLRALFDPASVAVVGASDDTSKWGNWLARGALEGEHHRRVYLVNRRGGTVLGRQVYESVSALPEAVELVVLCIPASGFEVAVDEALGNGAKAIVGITAGLAETGAKGLAREAAAARKVRDAGAVLLGPNCLGLSDAATELNLSSDSLPPGGIGLISQSGNLALELAIKARQAGVGFARFVSVGNQADLEVADFVAELAATPSIEVIAVYCEDFRNGRSFVEAAAHATRIGKPVILLAVGASGAAVRAARSHTGALVSADASVEAACRAAGIERVRTPKEMIDAAQALMLGHLPRGRRVGVVADGGGHGAIAADVVEASGLAAPAFSATLAARLSAATRTPGGTSNPVDLAGAGEQDIWSFARVVSELSDSDEVDAILLTGYFGGYGRYSSEVDDAEREVGSALAGLVESSKKPMVVHAMHRGNDESARANEELGPLGRLRAGRLPVYPNVEDAATSLARLAHRAEVLSGPLSGGRPRLEAARARGGPKEGGYFAGRALLERGGFRFAPARRATTPEAARKAAVDLGYPVVVKAVELEHKSDSGGVVLGISNDSELDRATAALWARLPGTALSVESMVERGGGLELLVGSVRDPRFGAIALVGLGGIYAEVLSDTAVALAPLDTGEAERLIGSLRGARLLAGSRGRRLLDVAAAAEALVVLSEIAASYPEISEIEVNPLLVTVDGAYGLDARLVLAPPAGDVAGAASVRRPPAPS
ncbi:MAG: acetate--CoA ligase family protein [Acidimicrobiales bacterium]